MRDDLKTILGGVAQFFVGVAISAAAVGLYLFSFSHEMPHESWIEVGQETLLFAALLLMGFAAKKDARYAGGIWLIAAFLTALFIRELDAWFDDLFHGAWKYILVAYLVWASWKIRRSGFATVIPGIAHFIRSPAFPMMLVGVVIVLAYSRLAYLVWASWKIRRSGFATVIPGIAHFIRSPAFPMMLVGVVIVLAYSRLYGYKGMWALYAGECSWGAIKTLSEEATELVGYAMMFYSSWVYQRLK